jgi:O-6-methylguanine DNA methyltransferase
MINVYVNDVGNASFGVAFEDESIFATNFGPDSKNCLRGLLKSIPFNIPFALIEKPSPFSNEVISELRDIYDGKDVSREFHLAVEGLTTHTQRVISATMAIPVGYAASYGEIARTVGGGPRSVGHVMADNPFPPLVPCHRVVGSDLNLRGYGGGLDVKLAFLKRERRGYHSEKDISVLGKKLRVFPVEFVLKKIGSS